MFLHKSRTPNRTKVNSRLINVVNVLILLVSFSIEWKTFLLARHFAIDVVFIFIHSDFSCLFEFHWNWIRLHSTAQIVCYALHLSCKCVKSVVSANCTSKYKAARRIFTPSSDTSLRSRSLETSEIVKIRLPMRWWHDIFVGSKSLILFSFRYSAKPCKMSTTTTTTILTNKAATKMLDAV